MKFEKHALSVLTIVAFFLIAIATIVICLSFKPDTKTLQKSIVIGPYHFNFPIEFKLFKDQGIDSYIGRIKNNKIEMHFDYGRWSSKIVVSPQEYLKFGSWREDAFYKYSKRNEKYNYNNIEDDGIKISLIHPPTTLDNDQTNADFIAVCQLDSVKFNFPVTIPNECKLYDFIEDTIRNYSRKIVIAKNSFTDITGIYLKDLKSSDNNTSQCLALVLVTRELTKHQQVMMVKIFTSVKIK